MKEYLISGCSDSYLGEFVPGDDSDDDDDEVDDNQDEDDEDIDIDSRKKLNCPSNGPSDKSIKSKTINSLKRKMRRNRTVFTELQLMGLERRFDSQKYLSTPDRAELARILGLTQLQVKTWYQVSRNLISSKLEFETFSKKFSNFFSLYN